VGGAPGDVCAGVPGIDVGSLRAAGGNIHLWATLRERPQRQPAQLMTGRGERPFRSGSTAGPVDGAQLVEAVGEGAACQCAEDGCLGLVAHDIPYVF
jgi:hypothetical protein